MTGSFFHGCWQILIFISFPFLSTFGFWLHAMFGVILIFGGNMNGDDLNKHRWRLFGFKMKKSNQSLYFLNSWVIISTLGKVKKKYFRVSVHNWWDVHLPNG